MKSFEPGFIESQPITQNLLQTIRLIGEYKGKQDLFKQQSPQMLETLRQISIVQSTESSNRIEGAKREMVLDAVERLPQKFQIADLERSCPGVSRPTINRVLADLRQSDKIRCIKPGRDAVWEKHDQIRLI